MVVNVKDFVALVINPFIMTTLIAGTLCSNGCKLSISNAGILAGIAFTGKGGIIIILITGSYQRIKAAFVHPDKEFESRMINQ